MNTIKIKGQDVDEVIINLDNVTSIDIVRMGIPYSVTFRMTDGSRVSTSMGIVGVTDLQKIMKPKELF